VREYNLLIWLRCWAVSFCKNDGPHLARVHLTGGILRHFRALSTPEQNPALEVLSTPAHPQVTLAVETVEKVLLQKQTTPKWGKNIQKAVFSYPKWHFGNSLTPFLSLQWEIFSRIFHSKGFSTVSLARYCP
jgi:hypothetical protein